MRYAPGVRSPMAHSHREQEEAYVVIGGSGRVRLDVGPQGPEGLELVAVGSDRPEGGDGVRAESTRVDD
jgi:hypothetical protein